MTITALYLWPWEMTVDSVRVDLNKVAKKTPAKTDPSQSIFQTSASIKKLPLTPKPHLKLHR